MPLQAKCPICQRHTVQGEDAFPFCSARCQDIDLGKWADEKYRIPGPPANLDELPKEDEDDEVRRR